MSDWQDITTAPKDGRQIIGWSSGWDTPTAIVWAGDEWDWMASHACPPSHDPTVWQPMPTPPESEP